MADYILKKLYQDYFKIGVACEKTDERFTNNEIGNPEKEKLIAKHFNSMTFANELKPMFNMGYLSAEAKEDDVPFVLNPKARAMLDWAKENGIPVRGHVMVWHSQCPKEFFCKNFTPVTIPTDPEKLKENPHLKFFEKLDPVCYVDRETLLKRLKSYIFHLIEYMCREDYADIIYAWDVVNEAIEPADKTETGVRISYWSQIIGPDYIYWAFRFARDAVEELSARFHTKKPLLFYNDYNEFDPEKKALIIANLKRETPEHGSVLSENLIDGIGMQGHLSDNNDVKGYCDALREYASLVREVHITELDVKCTCTNQNAEYYQAVFYKELFEGLIKAKKSGVNLTSVTFWGLTDDNSWIRGANPLLFHQDLTSKRAFDGLVYALTGESLGDPEPIERDLSDRHIDFEPDTDATSKVPAEYGFKARGFGEIAIQDREFHSGSHALANEKRFGAWSGISLDVSDFIGQTILIGAWVKSLAKAVNLKAELSGSGEQSTLIASAVSESADGSWVHLEGEYAVPSNVHSMYLYFDTTEEKENTFHAIYVDDVNIRLIGLKESFEGSSHIAAIRGMGHLPVLVTTDKEAVKPQTRSLLVTRQEKDATVKFDVSAYIGYTIQISFYVKTADTVIRTGLDGAVPQELGAFDSRKDAWTPVSVETLLPKELKSAEIYVETDGNADLYLDEIWVKRKS